MIKKKVLLLLGLLGVGVGAQAFDKEGAIIIQDPVYQTNQTVDHFLYPPIQPYHEDYLQVSDIHRLWFAEYGNRQGTPVVFLHGGPGFGCAPNDMRYFDPEFYRIILFDQRGALRSMPHGEMKDNTTADLIEDIEKIRKHLGIEKWMVFGGSWGSALSIAYGENHPDKCLGFVLRGIFLATKEEFRRIWYDMRDHYPQAWEEMNNFIPSYERSSVIYDYYERLMDPDPSVHMPAAKAFMKYDLTCAFLRPKSLEESLKNEKVVLGTARTFTHYGVNNFFMKEPNQLLCHLSNIAHLPAIIVQGQFDTICLIKQAYTLHTQWPGSELVIVPDAGHSAGELGNTKALVEATNKMKTRIQ